VNGAGLSPVDPQRQDAFMRMPWQKSKDLQLDLLDAEPEADAPDRIAEGAPCADVAAPVQVAGPPAASDPSIPDGRPMLVAISLLYEDGNNPRTEFPEVALEELAADIQHRGILQPLVVHPADGDGRHLIHFGAKRLRAAIRAGLSEVPIVVRDLPADRYAQVAENQKRHGLTPIEMAKFIREQVDCGDSNATIAKQLGMNLTTVAHHLSLLELPPALDDALKAGRCTSPRTLHELSKLHADNPEQVQSLLDSGAEITRTAVSALRAEPDAGAASEDAPAPSYKLIAQADAACDRLERALGRIQPSNSYKVALPELIALRIRVEDITKRWLQGSDRQTPR
jgi:ParB family transcriptional regulator, chromosome partitioning protein